jgi:copper(I)-binding protein
MSWDETKELSLKYQIYHVMLLPKKQILNNELEFFFLKKKKKKKEKRKMKKKTENCFQEYLVLLSALDLSWK